MDTRPQNVGTLILAAGLMFGILAGIAALANYYSLNIKAKTVAWHGPLGHTEGNSPYLCAGGFHPAALAAGDVL